MVTPALPAVRWQGFLLSEAIMNNATLAGIDLGKHSFHLHGQDKRGAMVFRKKLTRQQLIEFFSNFPVCTVVMEACAGAHQMARQLAACGHQVKLISPQFVRPFVKGNKNDFVDTVCHAKDRIAANAVGLAPSTRSVDSGSDQHDQPDSRLPA
jgi:transposase